MHQEKKMLAHISEDGTRVQTVADHLQGTAVLCGQFAAAFDAQQQGTWLGLLHRNMGDTSFLAMLHVALRKESVDRNRC